jgi:hypothetical protein
VTVGTPTLTVTFVSGVEASLAIDKFDKCGFKNLVLKIFQHECIETVGGFEPTV